MLTMAKCACATCNRVLPIREMIKMDKNDRGGAASYLCEEHAYTTESYTYEHDRTWGKDKVHGFTYGVELESMTDSFKSRVELLNRDWVASYDCTVEVEFKSPIMLGLNALSKDCEQIQKMNDRGEIDTIHEDCGTHLNIGNVYHINAETIDYLRRFMHSLFIPLSDYLEANPDKAEKVFGRRFTYYAHGIHADTNPMTHELFINFQHNNRVEFRLCKFITAKQYMNCAKMCTEMMTAIINNFILHFNDEKINKKLYKNEKEWRKHKADLTAQKLVKIFKKYENK